MAMLFGLDDDVFGESRVRPKKPDHPYAAKQCEHLWFMNGPEKGDDKLQCLIFQGDVFFHQKQWQQALQVYQRAMKIIPKRAKHNSAVRRLLLESVARCCIHLENAQLAVESALQLVNDSQNDDQRMVSQSLLANVYRNFDNPQGEVLCLQHCVQYHPFNVHFWLRLAKAYLTLSEATAIKMSSMGHKDSSKNSQDVRTQSTKLSSGDHHSGGDSSKGTLGMVDGKNGCIDCESSGGASEGCSNGQTTPGAALEMLNGKNANGCPDGESSDGPSNVSNGQTGAALEMVDSKNANACPDGESSDGASELFNEQTGAALKMVNGKNANGCPDGESSDGASDQTTTGASVTSESVSNRTSDVSANCQHSLSGPLLGIGEDKQSTETQKVCSDGVEKNECDNTCDFTKDGVGCCHGNIETATSLSCMCALRTSLNDDVSCDSLSPQLLKNFAVGCLMRSSILLGTVHHSVTSFAKSKNEELQQEIETKLASLQLDPSVVQQVRQYSEDDVFARGSKWEDGSIEEDGKSGDKEESSIVLLTGREFEQKWFAWAL